MSISLAPELEGFINQKVASGLYNSANEVIREALQLLKEQDELQRMRNDELRREIQKGLDSLDQGKGLDGPTAMAELIAKYSKQETSS
jgi:antitoxin ParD1/3/4